jgi:hypothetical protein
MMWVYSSSSQYGPKKTERRKKIGEMEEIINGVLQQRNKRAQRE